jgi:hypothetical protein
MEEMMDTMLPCEVVCGMPKNLYLYPAFCAALGAHMTHEAKQFALRLEPVSSKIMMLVEIWVNQSMEEKGKIKEKGKGGEKKRRGSRGKEERGRN